MKHLHWYTLIAGMAIGYFVVPMVVSAVRGAASKSA